jgi:hypothetical protein
MCLDKTGCHCHWGTQLGPNSTRHRTTTSFSTSQTPPDAPNPVLLTPNLSLTSNYFDNGVVEQPKLLAQPLQPSNIVNIPEKSTGKRKRATKATQKGLDGRQKSRLSMAMIPGIGPSTVVTDELVKQEDGDGAAGLLVIPHAFNSLTKSSLPSSNQRNDIWWFMRAVSSVVKTAYEDHSLPLEPPACRDTRPQSEWVGCIFCE